MGNFNLFIPEDDDGLFNKILDTLMKKYGVSSKAEAIRKAIAEKAGEAERKPKDITDWNIDTNVIFTDNSGVFRDNRGVKLDMFNKTCSICGAILSEDGYCEGCAKFVPCPKCKRWNYKSAVLRGERCGCGYKIPLGATVLNGADAEVAE